jgi:hypothetical protein
VVDRQYSESRLDRILAIVQNPVHFTEHARQNVVYLRKKNNELIWIFFFQSLRAKVMQTCLRG